ncbi:hypothetical protein FOL47_008830 [Perkinsus chesapeaki]|uniref:Uncharacterized protein n=1 Tax=Perkinsus chesapeaki TaxID=330153 RepID=A0A7J6LBU2_PERCH|nr:hypothetical protein FOL47_008830 [Perkinsus chesapeaki]
MSSTTTTGSSVHRRSKLDICPKDAIGRRKYQAVLSSRINAKSATHSSNKCECYGFQKLPPGLQAAILSVNAGVIKCRPPVSLIPSSACRFCSGTRCYCELSVAISRRARDPMESQGNDKDSNWAILRTVKIVEDLKDRIDGLIGRRFKGGYLGSR